MLRRTPFTAAILLPLVVLLCSPASAASGKKSGPRIPPPAAAKQLGHPRGAPAVADSSARFAPHRALVQFRPGVSLAAAKETASQAGGRVVRQISRCWAKDGSKLVVVESTTQSTAELVKQFSADPDVEYAEPDYIVHAQATPNDPRFNELWGMTKISAPGAWSIITGSSSVVIADIDTGVDYTHPDLAANMWKSPGEYGKTPGVDDDGNGYIDDIHGIDAASRDSDPVDDNGHGSHTSGTAAAVGNNSTGVAGVCWTARIMALKFLNSGSSGYTSDAITCINYVIWEKNHGVNVVVMNNSWGGGAYVQSLKDAITAAGDAGIVFVASAGNGGSDGIGDNNDTTPSYPASYDCPNIIAVAATNASDTLAGFSNYGATSVDLAAPGVSILSTVPTFADASGYTSWEGTSMAAPHVSGAVALCAVRFPSDTMAQRRSRVLGNVDPVAALSGKCVTGGRLDVAKAVGGVAPGDDDIPGLPLTASPVAGTVGGASDMDDVYSVFLHEGDRLNASVTGAGGTNFNLYLFSPTVTTVSNKAIAVASATGSGYPDAFSCVVPTTGTYYLDVYGYTGSGTYTLTYGITNDDDIPGVAIPASPFGGTVSTTDDPTDVFAVPLVAGETFSAAVTGPAGTTDFDLYLFPPGASSVWTDPFVARARHTAYPDGFDYVVPTTGTYYLRVYAYEGAGTYQVTYSVQAPDPDDDIPGVAIPASPFGGTVSDSSDQTDVFAVSLTAGRTFSAAIAGAGGTGVDLYLFPPGASSVWTDPHVARARHTAYPDGFDYVVPTTGTYYLMVYAYEGAGTYQVTYSEATGDTVAPTTTAHDIPSGWVNHNVSVTLSAVDTGGSGVARSEYRLESGGWTTYTAPVSVSAQGQTTLSYRSVDGANNVEATRTAVIRIDKTKPSVTPLGIGAPGTWVNRNATIMLAGSDALSGVGKLEYRLGSGAWSTYGTPVTISTEGETPFSYRATDNAGNISGVGSATVRIDKTGPGTRALKKVTAKRARKAVFGFRIDERTATAKVVIKIYKGRKLKKQLKGVGWRATNRTQRYTWRRCALARGTYTWRVYAVDEAGNAQKSMTARKLVVK